MRTFLLPASTLILYFLISCSGTGRNGKDVLEGKWNLDSTSIKKGSSFKSRVLQKFFENDSSLPDLEFRKDSFFIYMGDEADTLKFIFNPDRRTLSIIGQEDQPYLITIIDEKNAILVTSDSDQLFLKKL